MRGSRDGPVARDLPAYEKSDSGRTLRDRVETSPLDPLPASGSGADRH